MALSDRGRGVTIAVMRLRCAPTSLITLVLACLLAALAASAAPAAGLRPDRSFGVRGVAVPDLGPTYYQSAFTSIEPQADGSILAGRREGSEALERFARFDAAGRPAGGPVPESTQPHPEATQPDGKVVKLADEESLERVDPDGTQDPSFGTQPYGDGKRSDTVDFRIEAIVIQPSGDILVAGTKSHLISSGAPPEPEQVTEQLCVARLEPSGRLDPAFGHGGIVHLHSDLGFAGEGFVGLASRPGGGAVVIDRETFPPPADAPYHAPASYLVGLDGAGGLDPGYGEGGEVRLGATVTEFVESPGGKLLLAGDAWSAKAVGRGLHESDFFLARYGDDGRPDPGFAGGAPAATADFGGIDVVGSLLVEADGSILLGGSSTATTLDCLGFSNFCTETPALARFTADGAPDPGFGEGGRVTLGGLAAPFVGLEGRGVEALAPRPGGGLFVGGGSGADAFLAALAPVGSLAAGFGEGGVTTVSEPRGSRAGAHSIAVDADGRILIGGGTDAGLSTAGPEGAVFRLRSDGAVDRGYGEGGGFARLPFEANAIAAAGNSVYVLSFHEPLLSRLRPDGRLDRGFGREGSVEPGLGRDQLHLLATLRGGGVLIGGSSIGSNPRGVVVRFSASGARDRAFGKGGIATLAFGYRGRCGAEAIAVQADGRILVAGYVQGRARGRTVERLAVMRLLADGRVDRSFGRGGLVRVARGTEARATAIAVEPDGEIIVAGRSRAHKQVSGLLLKLSAAGGLERGFGDRGVAAIPAPDAVDGRQTPNVEPSQILIRPAGYLVVGKGTGQPLTFFDHRGRADRRFAVGIVAPQGRDFGTPAAALQGGRLLLARTTTKPATFQVQRVKFTAPRRGGAAMGEGPAPPSGHRR
jgi:uncharacterized delta-60 repeat protein